MRLFSAVNFDVPRRGDVHRVLKANSIQMH